MIELQKAILTHFKRRICKVCDLSHANTYYQNDPRKSGPVNIWYAVGDLVNILITPEFTVVRKGFSPVKEVYDHSDPGFLDAATDAAKRYLTESANGPSKA